MTVATQHAVDSHTLGTMLSFACYSSSNHVAFIVCCCFFQKTISFLLSRAALCVVASSRFRLDVDRIVVLRMLLTCCELDFCPLLMIAACDDRSGDNMIE